MIRTRIALPLGTQHLQRAGGCLIIAKSQYSIQIRKYPKRIFPKPEIEYHIKSNYSSTALRVLRHIGDVKLSYQVLLICNISSCKLHIDIFLILLFLILYFRPGVTCLIKIQSFLPDDRRRRCRPGFCQRLCLWQQE